MEKEVIERVRCSKKVQAVQRKKKALGLIS
jgi:hypothetical protein